ncbi:hypothetical protein [Paenibacillus sp. y28]|uniref:hypothetical protein n=1 Tax=Paenibacillus sp. y28 TaxID=3129110 RepID=UPI00301595A6
MDAIYARLVQLNDEWTEQFLEKQVNDPASKYNGGIMDATGIPRPNHGGTPSVMAVWACALAGPDSRYYRDGKLLQALDKAADFILNRQHADGTVSLGSTNFNSPPDTAFVVGGLTQVYRLLEGMDRENIKPVAAKLRLFLERTIPAMLTGGCHTPNHRWVITAALALLYEIFGLPALVERAEEWLAEGMDITADGEWTERSNGIYNAVSDIALYFTARIFGKPELLDTVRRNLKMMAYLVHPSGEVVTDYSGRQDFGQMSSLANYLYVYRLMAAYDRDPQFAALSDYAGSFVTHPEAVNNNALLGFLLYPEMEISDVPREALPKRYNKTLNLDYPIDSNLLQAKQAGHHMQIEHSSMHVAFGAPVIRIREEQTSVTVMSRTPSFFSLRHGKVRLLGVKLTSAFSPGVVKFDQLTVQDDQYEFSTCLQKGYNGPIPRAHLPEHVTGGADISPWYLLPHQHRSKTHVQTHELNAVVTQEEDGWSIRIRSDEREDVCAQLTFILGSEGQLTGDDVQAAGEDKYFLKSGSAVYSVGDDAIEIGSGAWDHHIPVLREDHHAAGCIYVHVNLVTPFDHTFTITLK